MQQSVLDFLTALDRNNNREWFTAHKDQYTNARAALLKFVEELIAEIARFDKGILQVDASKSLFRIYRDTRFSLNKAPYKVNFGANLSYLNAGYYLHIQPGKSFLAGGIYMLEPDQLKELRKEISCNAETFREIVSEDSFCRYFGGLSEEGKLKRMPAGFEKDDPMAEYLKLKNFVAVCPLPDEALFGKNAAKQFAEMYQTLKPLVDFLNAPLQ